MRGRRESGGQGRGSLSSFLTSDWFYEDMPGKAGAAMTDVLGGWPGQSAPCYLHGVARPGESS